MMMYQLTARLKCLFLAGVCLAMGSIGVANETTPFPDLELMAKPYVLKTWQLQIPGCEDAFNPSMVRYEGNILVCFRTRHPVTQSTNRIGFVWFDKKFRRISDPQIIDMPSKYSQLPSFAQDPRLIMVDDDLMMVYSNWADIEGRTERRMVIAKLKVKHGKIKIGKEQLLDDFEGQTAGRIEKNWTPFEYRNKLHLAYSINPLRILKPFFGNRACKTISQTQADINWPWGEIRGGTTAMLEDDVYLSFFHSSKEMKTVHSSGKKISHYFIGAYTFSAKPPFKLESISPEPIIAEGFYTCSKEYVTWKPLRVVFPGGHICSKRHVWVIFGKQDHELWVMKLDKKALLDSLVPVVEQSR